MLQLALFLLVLFWCMIVFNLGYLVASRIFGYEITRFSIGLGPRLTGFTLGNTIFELRLILLGAYVQFNNEGEVSWRSTMFSASGPAANFMLAVAMITALYMVRYPKIEGPDAEPLIGYILPGSPADIAGLRAGDRVVRVGQLDNPTWNDVAQREAVSASKPLHVKLERGRTLFDAIVTPVQDLCSTAGFAGWSKQTEVRIVAVHSESPARKAAVKEGDLIVSVNGEPIESVLGFGDAVRSSRGNPLKIALRRQGVLQVAQLTPTISKERRPERFTIGVTVEPKLSPKITRLPFAQALHQSIQQNLQYAGLLYEFLKSLWARRSSVPMAPQFAPPFDGAPRDRAAFIELVSAISLNLAILNLLPIPMLVGGQILMNVIQLLSGTRFSDAANERITQVGLVSLMIVFAFVLYGDIVRMQQETSSGQETPPAHMPCSSPRA